MERKTTELEQRLIGNGYRLTNKQYGGRKSEKTLYYDYEKHTPTANQFVRLDSKREKVLACGLKDYSCKALTRIEVEGIKIIIRNIEDDIKRDYEEMVKVEPTKGTFEQLDEENVEKESE